MVYIILGVFVVFSVIIIITVVSSKNKPLSKGEKGEIAVAQVLGETISGEQYVINDLLFSDNSGHSCQIDHIYINKYGIWIIETKNYSGHIYGNEAQREWTQVLAYGNTKHKFYNPLKQNASHIYHLTK